MPTTEIWKQFGDSITAAPHLTLAAFLGHSASIEVAQQHGMKFPVTADFQADPAYDPNRHQLDLDPEYVKGKLLLLSVATWGVEPLRRCVNACSLLQCLHHSPPNEDLKRLRDEAAFSVYSLIDSQPEELKTKGDALLRRCQAEYRPHEKKPDSKAAKTVWFHLGAPWFGLETCLSNLAKLEAGGETEPGPSNSTWINRQSVWPSRALEAAAYWSSYALVSSVVRSTLIAWATAAK